MTRVTSLFVSALALAAVSAGPAGAKDKAFCRAWASDVADRNANAGEVVEGAVVGAAGSQLLGGATDGQDGAGSGAMTSGTGDAVLTGATTGDRWEQVYRRAYADCRAS